MARVASCPQCEHELVVPDGADADAWATCPECQAFFALKDAKSRELPEIVLVEPDVEASDPQGAPTVADLPAVATWTNDPQQDLEIDESGEESGAGTPRLADQDRDSELFGQKSPDAAAERIDAWFRSAKTLSDVPQPESASDDQSEDATIGPANRAAGGATIDLSGDDAGVAGLNSDFELERASQSPRDAATWDDSQHMERLLADLQNQPSDSFEAAGHESIPATDEEHVQPTEDWAPDVSLRINPSAGKPRRKRSIVRTLLVSAVGGVVGLGLGYYALLWIRGPEIDFLELAKYLPKAALPASFRSEAKPSPAARPSSMVADLAASEKAAETTAKTADAPAEKQAAFTEPVEPAKSAIAADDRQGTSARKGEAAAREPAKLDAPPATALTESTPHDAVHIAHAPSFTTGELTAALQAAKEAQPSLVNGNLTDGKEVQHAKGFGYSVMADLAQKATFVGESTSAAEATKSSQEIDGLFRQTLSNIHTREEVAQIVPKWIASPNRRHGGVFFAGSVTHQESKGTVVECSVELGDGQSLTVLLPAAIAREINGSARRVGIAGWIVDKPAEQVAGYTGSAPQAVFAQKLISLE